MRIVRAIALSVSWMLLVASATSAAILRVPQNHTTIGAALLAAQSGDTVLVSPGTYQENLVWPSVDGIRLVSVAGPTSTTITASGSGRVITFVAGLTRATVIDGFTITGGSEPGVLGRGYGGAILIPSSSPTIVNNTITLNACAAPNAFGGGIAVRGTGTPLIAHNTIATNRAGNGNSPSYGGGISLLDDSFADVLANRILGNSIAADVLAYGGGIHVNSSNGARILGNVIDSNAIPFVFDVTGRGGGIAVERGATQIVNNTIVSNLVGADGGPSGGGIAVMASGVVVRNNILAFNQATGSQAPVTGGAVACLVAGFVREVNNLWKNTPDDYSPCLPGISDYMADPRFADAARHLAPNSPNIDVPAATIRAPAGLVRDIDGDSRRVDGKLTGTSAHLDVGADEYTAIALTQSGTTGRLTVGGSVTFSIAGPAGDYRLLLGATPIAAFIGFPGYAFLGSPFALLASGATPGVSPAFAVPNVTALVGARLSAQALVFGATWAVLTNDLRMTFV